MALTRPTLDAIYTRIQADWVALSGTGGAILRRSVEYALSRIVARIAHGLYAYQDDAVREAFPDTCGIVNLRRWGALFGVAQNLATAAAGDVVFTGTNGTAIPAGTEIAIGGLYYTTDSLVTVAAGTATVAVTASLAGSASNAEAAATGSLTSPIAGIDTTVTVDSGGLIGGTDDEGLEAYRARVLNRMSNPPRGGTVADFEAWISETTGVSVFRSWVYPAGDGVGTVAATFTVVNTGAPEGFAVPSAGNVTAVQTYVDTQKPADMRSFRAYAVTGETLNLSVTLNLEAGADRATVELAAEAALAAMLGTDAEPATAIPLSRISEVISTTAGEASHVITSPVSDPTPSSGAIFNDVVVTWSP